MLAEKPIGQTAADTERVLAVAERTGRMLGVCYPNRANPAVMDARRMVADGVIGPLVSVEMRMITTQVRFRDPQHWLFRSEYAGGGILSWLGCHYIDMMRYITGDEIVSVAAETATRSGEDIDVEDVAVLSLRFRSGAVGTLHTGYMLALSGGGYHNQTGYDTYVGVNGQTGRLYWSSDGRPASLTVESVHPDWAGAPAAHVHVCAGGFVFVFGRVWGTIRTRLHPCCPGRPARVGVRTGRAAGGARGGSGLFVQPHRTACGNRRSG